MLPSEYLRKFLEYNRGITVKKGGSIIELDIGITSTSMPTRYDLTNSDNADMELDSKVKNKLMNRGTDHFGFCAAKIVGTDLKN